MQRVMGIFILVLMTGVVYLGWREFLNEERYESIIHSTSLSLDTLRAKTDSLKAKRKVIRSLTASIKQREKERKYEAFNLGSIDSLAFIANQLLAGKGN